MSGHSKWATIKHKKGALDAKRGALFTKIIKELTTSARSGGGNPDANPRLRTVLQKAREANMPADNIDRAIKKGTGELPGVMYEEFVYEGYGPGGVAILIDILTDNKNRTASEIRSIMEKRGGNMSGSGSVSWQFHKKGLIALNKTAGSEDKIMELALNAGASDFNVLAEGYEITTEPQDFEAVKKAITDAGIQPESADLTKLPQNLTKVTTEQAKGVMALLEALEEHEDVQNVYSSVDIPDETGVRILGVDPGLLVTGYGVIAHHPENAADGGFDLIEAGVVRTKAGDGIAERLRQIYDSLAEVIKEHRPDTLVIEKLYAHYKHPTTAILMGHARGAVCLLSGTHNIPMVSIASTHVKKAVTGMGHAGKFQVQRMVQHTLRLKNMPDPPDVADALAVAITFASSRARKKVAG